MLLRRIAGTAGAIRRLSTAKPTIQVTFVLPTGQRVTVPAPIGDSLLEVAQAHGVDIEGAHRARGA